MNTSEWFKHRKEEFEQDSGELASFARMMIYEDILERMESLNMSRAKLAAKLQCSPAYITQLFSDTANVSINKLVEIAMALDCDIEFTLVPRDRRLNKSIETKANLNASLKPKVRRKKVSPLA